ncbi:bicyclomycin resistance protein, putative [Talaromyces stipitatus ATCC 10500]|uniref:Bicyclomycin resistance protein, putative n=1 Tax=Talaromyces stipitatus (strain ATCC 10500 / CBS 375.48 / QM 6759 / NRRL 1006) TaxID=441959 RepID=B8LZM3_TALSN|nr:bicyclomycin resistance protein, putative [Talaromyces stipitatus ATCC 10500]EED22446.1 bicyclomycin resistance protein, putative [Talaromyces stipitatus ATCC 10500]
MAELQRSTTDAGNIAILPKNNKEMNSYDLDGKSHEDIPVANHNVKTSADTFTNNDQTQIGDRYSIYSRREKLLILSGSASAAIFSSLSVQIYLPALNMVADSFNVSSTKINFTVTSYMFLQGIVPMVIGGFSDRIGRRPAFMTCFVIYFAANIGLALTRSYAMLMGLRCLQATGIAATQTLAQAVLSDLITSGERGGYIVLITLPGVIGTTVGPLGGGALAQNLGWRSIFWFLTIAAGICLCLLFIFFPETNRRLVGDGSINPPTLYQTPWQLIKVRCGGNHAQHPQDHRSKDDPTQRSQGFVPSSIFASFILLKNPEFTCLLIYGSIMYATIYAYATALPSQMADICLMYLPNIGGTLVAAAFMGKVMNWNYARHVRKMGLPPVDRSRQMDLSDFPIERARLEIAIPLILATAIITVGWGWALDARTGVAVPCVLLFAIGITYISVINVFNALISDYYRKTAATAVATNWFVRCMVGAAMSAAILPLINVVGPGWAYTIVAALLIIFSPLVFITMWRGLKWRQERAQRRAINQDDLRI